MPDILAAGVVVFRPGRDVLLVHRPKYDDWSFPKGKLDRGEHPTAAAVREVAEETGLHVRLGPPLPTQRYPVGQRTKAVHYWTGRAVGTDDVTGYHPNDEIDEVTWVRIDDAPGLLTYDYDRGTLEEALRIRRRSRAVVVLRHGQARSREAWRGDDADRTLLRTGEMQADRLVPLLAAYDVTRIVTSPSTRCVQTVRPYADTAGQELEVRSGLSEEGASEQSVSAVLDDLLDADAGSVVCTHRPVLEQVYDVLGLDRSTLAPLEAGEMLVLHVRKHRIVSLERWVSPTR